MYKPIRKADLVIGGTTVKQGEIFTLGFQLFDAAGLVIVPTVEQTITVKVANSMGVVFETVATVVSDHIEFTVDENIGSGKMRVELKVTDGANVLQKYPANGYIELLISASLDNVDEFGLSPVTADVMIARIVVAEDNANAAATETRVVKDATEVVRVDTLQVKADTLQVKSDTLAAKVLADTAATNANTKAGYATTQGDYAKQVGNDNKLIPLATVDTVALRDSTYPNPLNGSLVTVTQGANGNAETYRFVTGTGWVLVDTYNGTTITNINSQLADTTNEIGEKTTLPAWLQDDLRTITKKHDDYLRQFGVNVMQPPFNAKGDADATGSDVLILQSAIDYCLANKLTLIFPKGTFCINDTLIWKQVNVLGSGKNSTVIKYVGTSAKNATETDSTTWINDIDVRNFKIQNTGQATNGLRITKCLKSSFNNIKIEGMKSNGLLLDVETYYNHFSNITIDNVTLDGIYCKGFTSGGIDDGTDMTYRSNANSFTNVLISKFGQYGLNMNQCSGNIFNLIGVEVLTSTGTRGINLYNCKANTFNGAWAEMNSKGYCVFISGLSRANSSSNKFIGGQLVPHESTASLTKTAVYIGTGERNMFINNNLARATIAYQFGSGAYYNTVDNANYDNVTTKISNGGTLNKERKPENDARLGSITFPDNAVYTNITIPLSPVEIDANYKALVSVSSITGSPSLAAKQCWVQEKTTSSFKIYIGGAVGVGNTITIDWRLERA